MHSISPVVKVIEPSWNAFGKQVSSSVQESIVTDISEGCAHSFANYSLFYFIKIFSKYKWFYYFILTQVIFRHFFSEGIGNKLLRVCYNINYPIQSKKFLRSEIMVCNWGYVSWYRGLTISFVRKYYGRWEIGHTKGMG